MNTPALSRARVVRIILWIGLLGCVAVGCTSGDCADVGTAAFPPADTTVSLGQSIVLTAGQGGRCIGGPVTFSSVASWKANDSTIVSIAVLDSSRALITGRAVGSTLVIASVSPAFAGTWSTTQVTVR